MLIIGKRKTFDCETSKTSCMIELSLHTRPMWQLERARTEVLLLIEFETLQEAIELFRQSAAFKYVII